MPDPRLEEVARAICEFREFELIEFVGEGAFKETFHARSAEGNSIAVKVLRSGSSTQRTEREIEAMTRCDHPALGKLIALDEIVYDGERHTYYLEEFLSGGTLTSYLLQNGVISSTETKVLGATLIDAVAHLAERDLVHRDLKPDNVLFRVAAESPVIVDFGIVRNLAERSLTGTWLMRGPGTPLFAAPEQLNNDKELIDWRTDQFSLGLLLSICALGRHPYAHDGDTPDQVVGRVAERERLPETFTAAAEAVGLPILTRMVAAWPAERFRRPVDLATAWSTQLEEV
jgi:serine/threonine protein kinase